ncbi:XdhC family protein [Hymenobacter weizhouensis]|uniref:XdhC family protein n=1 Tax=Hymenobacter sp. YIM 151500-1 TaxID=2987689 RepID=UPI00222702DF|nr:XdhC/CoxI family protein [Hymenobacter sp. YIM 151500-1]UYZ64637.1 XdhC family protein [Hymenobacter sp. YIM 151500-1]
MTELQRLLRAYDEHRAAGRACALASVVDVQGSAYRRPGARMLLTADGQLTGAISGGCLEGDARQRARRTIEQGRPAVVTYDSTDPDDDLQFGAALGCQGVVQILLEPLDFRDPANPVELLRRWAEGVEAPAVVATVFSLGAAEARLGQRLLLTADGAAHGTLPEHSALYAAVLADARAALTAGQPATRHYPAATGAVRVSLEILRPPVRLTVYGAGNDVQPLVRLAAGLGWRVTVLDGRPAQAQPARFPEADAVRVLPLAQVAEEPHQPGSFALLMTHNYHYDRAVLRHLLPATSARYIGLLGPRKKYERLLADLQQEVPDAAEQLRARLHSPIGLNLGAETPEEIALSIVAEIQAVLTGRPAGFLRDSPHPIHPPLQANGPLVAEGRVDAVCGL